MQKLQLSNSAELRRVLRHEVYRTHETHYLHRLHCVVLVSEGHSCYEVANMFGENPRTIERWVHSMVEKGIEGLRDKEKPGRKAKLDDAQIEMLKLDLSKPPWSLGYRRDKWCGELLSSHIEKQFAVELSARQCQRLLKKLRLEEVSGSPV